MPNFVFPRIDKNFQVNSTFKNLRQIHFVMLGDVTSSPEDSHNQYLIVGRWPCNAEL